MSHARTSRARMSRPTPSKRTPCLHRYRYRSPQSLPLLAPAPAVIPPPFPSRASRNLFLFPPRLWARKSADFKFDLIGACHSDSPRSLTPHVCRQFFEWIRSIGSRTRQALMACTVTFDILGHLSKFPRIFQGSKHWSHPPRWTVCSLMGHFGSGRYRCMRRFVAC